MAASRSCCDRQPRWRRTCIARAVRQLAPRLAGDRGSGRAPPGGAAGGGAPSRFDRPRADPRGHGGRAVSLDRSSARAARLGHVRLCRPGVRCRPFRGADGAALRARSHPAGRGSATGGAAGRLRASRTRGRAPPMNPALVSPTGADERDVLSAALRLMRGPDASLEDWSAQPLTKHGKQRVVRYDLRARAAPGREVCYLQWVGKFYEDDGAARRVAAVLLQLAGSDCGERGEVEVPRVLAYDAPRRLLLLTHEAGESVVSAIAHQRGPVVPAIGRALAALHGTPVSLDATTAPARVLGDLRPRVADLCTRFPGQAGALRAALTRLERDAPPQPAAPSFLHGDFGTANLLWRPGRLVVLDFDRCTRGDPALDLGYLL